MSRRILALDLGPSTGWAVWLSESGEEAFGTREHPGKDWVARLDAFARWLTLMIETHYPSLVALESTVPTPLQHTRGEQDGMFAIAALTCRRRNLKIKSWAPRTIKYRITGSGNADKHALRRAIQAKRPGVLIRTDHEADALAVLEVAREDGAFGDGKLAMSG